MRPIDHRTATWRDIRAQLTERRLRVLAGLREHGPCTTRELADRMGMDILSVRPRITELGQLGYVECLDTSAPGPRPPALSREGVYRALDDTEAEHIFQGHKAAAINPQLTLAIPA